ncbi:hypothetical protein LCGC14_1528960 [marine sediment metagenome]|uniref:Uncharacterized protein n=1 Tax=marine sediment metagenome TaxID=412755 RepID=A0A0F9IWR2_9ZZZZ
MSISESNLWRIAACLVLIVGLSIAILLKPTCSKSSVREMTWGLDLMKSEQASNQSMLYLTEQILEWEKIADDFSMHDDWMRRKTQANIRLIELNILIPDLQIKLNECSQKGD